MLYDWSSQGYVMIVHTVIFSLYFLSAAARGLGDFEVVRSLDESGMYVYTYVYDFVRANAYWSLANTATTIIAGLLAPVIGTLSGFQGMKKLIFTIFAYMGIIGTIALALVPEHMWWMLLAGFLVASMGFAGSNKIYDAFLVDVSKKENMNRVSSVGFGLSYIGGALPFIISIPFVFVAELGLMDISVVTAYRIAFWIAGIWWIVFSIPMFKNVKQVIGVPKEPQFIRKSFVKVWTTFLDIKKHKPIVIFLVAFFLYSDGLGSIIRLATSYGATIGIGPQTLIIVLLVTQFVAFPCAIIYGKVSEKIGTKNMIYFGIGTYCIICMLALGMNPARDLRTLTIMFWALAMMVGTAQGGVQALSRSYFGRIIPKEKSNEYFGFYNVFGRFASVLGTTFFGVVSLATGQPHYGIGVIVLLFIAAAIIFKFAPDDRDYMDKVNSLFTHTK